MSLDFNTSYKKLESLLTQANDESKWSYQKPMKWRIVQAALEATKSASTPEDWNRLRDLEWAIQKQSQCVGSWLFPRIIKKISSSALNLYNRGQLTNSEPVLYAMPLVWKLQKIFADNQVNFDDIRTALFKGKRIEVLEAAEKAPEAIKALVIKTIKDHYVKPVEGTYFESLKSFFKEYSDSNEKYENASKLLKNCYLLNSLRLDHSSIFIARKVRSLKEGESVVIEGSDHELYQIKKTGKDTYDVYCYDRSEEASITTIESGLSKKRLCPFTKYSAVPENLLDARFLGNLRRGDWSKKPRQDRVGYLKGYRTDEGPDVSLFMSSNSNWNALFRNEFGIADYKKFRFDFKTRRFSQTYRSYFAHSPAVVGRGAQKYFVDQAEKLLRSAVKNQNELTTGIAEDIARKKEHVSLLTPFESKVKERSPFLKKGSSDFFGVPSLSPNWFWHWPSIFRRPLKPSLVDPLIEKCPDAEKLCGFLSTFNPKSPTGVEKLAAILPIGKEEYWKAIPKKDRAHVMSFLWDMASRYKADPNYSLQADLLPIQTNTVFALLAHAHALSVVIDPDLANYRIPYESLKNTDPLTPCFRNEDKEQRAQLIEYFARFTGDEIFRFEPKSTFDTKHPMDTPEAKTFSRIAKTSTQSWLQLKKYEIKTRMKIFGFNGFEDLLEVVGKKPLKFSFSQEAIEAGSLLDHCDKIFSNGKTRYINELRDMAYLTQSRRVFSGRKKKISISTTGGSWPKKHRNLKGDRARFRVNWFDEGDKKSYQCAKENTEYKPPESFKPYWRNLTNSSTKEEVNLQEVFSEEASENEILLGSNSSLQSQLKVDMQEPHLLCSKVILDFERDLTTLSQEKKQSAFFCMLFYAKDPLLPMPLVEALKNKGFCTQLTGFIDKGLSYFSTSRPDGSADISGCLFFSELIRRVKELNPGDQYLIKALDDFGMQSRINELLEKKGITERERLNLHLCRALLYSGKKEPMQEDDALQFFSSQVFFQNHKGLYTSWSYFHQDRELDRLGKRIFSPLDTGIFTDAVLNGVVFSSIETFPIGTTWNTSRSPLFSGVSDNGNKWTIDLVSGHITCNGEACFKKQYAPIQNEALFGKEKIRAIPVGKYLEFTEGERKFRELLDRNFTPSGIFQMQEGDKWFEYIPVEKFVNQFESSEYRRTIPNIFLSDYHVFTDGKTVLFLDRKSKEIICRYNGTSLIYEQETLKGQKIYLRKERRIPTLQAIETPRWQVFEETLEGVVRARLPRLKDLTGDELSFERPLGEKFFVWSKDPSYKLAIRPPKQGPLGSFRNYVLLENEGAGKKKVLIPIKNHNVNATNGYAIDPTVFFDTIEQGAKLKPVEQSQAKTTSFLEFDLDQNNELNPLDNEGKIYLSYLYLCQKKPEKAFEIFKKMPEAADISPVMEGLLGKIVDLSNTNISALPGPSIAMSLRAGIVLLRSKAKKQEDTTSLKDELNKLLVKYGNLKNRAKEFSLSDEELGFLGVVLTNNETVLTSFRGFFGFKSESSGRIFPPDDATVKRNSDRMQYTFDPKTQRHLFNFDGRYYSGLYNAMRGAKNDQARLAIAVKNKHYLGSKNAEIFSDIFTVALYWDEVKTLFSDLKGNLPEPSADFFTKPPFDADSIGKIKEHLAEKYKDTRLLTDAEIDRLPKSVRLIAENIRTPKDVFTGDIPAIAKPTNYAFLDVAQIQNTYFETPTKKGSIDVSLNWSSKNKSAAFEREKQEVEESFQQGKKEREEELTYSLKDGQTVEDCKKALLAKKNEIEQVLKLQEEDIVILANKLPADEALAKTKKLLIEGRFQKEVCLEELVTAFLDGNYESYQKLNPHLSEQDIEALDGKIRKFLISSNEKDRLTRAYSLNQPSLIGRELFSKFQYEDPFAADSRVFLVFEHRANLNLRKKQVNLIKQMLAVNEEGSYKDCVGELMMGQGKTSVLTSILLHMAAKKGRIAFFVCPKSQFSALAIDLASRQKDNFYKEIITMDYERVDLTTDRLTWMKNSFADAKKNQKVIFATPETLQSIPLELETLLCKPERERTAEERKKIDLLIHLKDEMKNYGDVVIDEVHQVLSAKNKLLFTQGSKQRISRVEADIVEDIVALHLDKEIQRDLAILQNSQGSYGKENYEKNLLPKILKKFYEKHPNINLSMNLSEIENPILKLQVKAAQEAFRYLPLALEKTAGQRYGRTFVGDREAVVPYASSNNPTTREFGSAVESAIYHFLTVLSHREHVPESQLRRFIEKQVKNAQEINLHQQTPFLDTEPAKQFEEITGFSLAYAAKEKNVPGILQAINSDPIKMMKVEKEVICQIVGSHTEYHASDAQRFSALFATRRALTGTPPGKDVLPKSLQTIYRDSSKGTIISACLEKEKDRNSPILVVPPTVEGIMGKVPDAKGCIDSAGLFKNDDNEALARQILENSKPEQGFAPSGVSQGEASLGERKKAIQTVLFFGRDGSLMALKQGIKEPIYIGSTLKEEIKKHGIDLASTYVLFDDGHSEGTDIAQDPKAVNTISIDHKTTLERMLQGLLRLRLFLEEQNATYLISSLEEKHFSQPMTMMSLIEKGVENQAKEKMKETAEAYKQKIDCIFKEALLPLGCKEKSLEKYKGFFAHSIEETYPSDLTKYLQERFTQFKDLVSDEDLIENVRKELDAILAEINASVYYVKGAKEQGESQIELQSQKELATATMETVEEKELRAEFAKYQGSYSQGSYKELEWGQEGIENSESSVYNEKVPSGKPAFYPIDSILQQDVYKPHDYASLFTSMDLYATSNFIHVRDCFMPVFASEQKEANQILFFEKGGKMQAVLLSSHEAEEHLKKNPDAWILLPNGHAYGKESPPLESIKELLWHINFFAGNVDYLITDKDRTKELMTSPLRQRFLRHKVEANPLKKKIFKDAHRIFHPS